MSNNELTENNFIRICLINWMLTPILMFFFAWPYYQLGEVLNLEKGLMALGAVIFSFSFTITILHGHVSVAVGKLHAKLYYDWLESHPFSYGILFHSVMVSTRFRISILLISIIILIIDLLI